MAHQLKSSYDLLTQEKDKVYKCVNDFVQEIQTKLNSVSENVSFHKKGKLFYEMKNVIDDGINKLNRICEYLQAPDDNVLKQATTTTLVLSSSDSESIRGLITRIEVMEKAMSGYKNDNEDIRKLQRAESETVCGLITQIEGVEEALSEYKNDNENIRKLQNTDSESIRGLKIRIEVMERGMSGYKNDNEDIRKLQKADNETLKSLKNLMGSSITKWDHAQATTDKRIKDISETFNNDKNSLLHKITLLSGESKEFMKKEAAENAKRDEKLGTLAQDCTSVKALWNDFFLKTSAYCNEMHKNIKLLEQKIAELNARSDELDKANSVITDSQSKLLQGIAGVSNKASENGSKILALDTGFADLKQKATAQLETMQRLRTSQDKFGAEIKDIKDAQKFSGDKLSKECIDLAKLKEEFNLQIPKIHEQLLNSLQRKAYVGFTATPSGLSSVRVAELEVVTKFDSVAYDEGKHYNPTTGFFTAPRYGLYVTSVTLCTLNSGRVNLNVKHKPTAPGRHNRKVKSVCRVSATAEDNSLTSLGVVQMEAGDVLYMLAVTVTEDAVLSCYSSFSCYLLS